MPAQNVYVIFESKIEKTHISSLISAKVRVATCNTAKSHVDSCTQDEMTFLACAAQLIS